MYRVYSVEYREQAHFTFHTANARRYVHAVCLVGHMLHPPIRDSYAARPHAPNSSRRGEERQGTRGALVSYRYMTHDP